MDGLTGLGSAQQAYRKGNLVVVPRGAALPPYCVKCGAPATGDSLMTNFSWHNPWLYLTIFFGLLIYIIIALVVRKKVSLVIPTCEAHQLLRRRLLWVGMTLLVGAIPVSILIEEAVPAVGGWSMLLMVILIFAGLIVVSPSRQFLRPKFIDEVRAEFSGAADAFLSRLPETP